jgi:molybdenum transport protein
MVHIVDVFQYLNKNNFRRKMMNLLQEDTQGLDLTTLGLEIGSREGVMTFKSKFDITLSGMSEVLKIQKELDIETKIYKHDGEKIQAGETILESFANAEALHKAWKISQNVLEYMSGVATYTNDLLQAAKEVNPNISIATTRKNFPGSKKLMLDAVLCGGGVPHRLGTYDSILLFEQHRDFFSSDEEFERHFYKLKSRFLEKRVAVEVDSYAQALYFAKLGADVLQCEKMSFAELSQCVTIREEYPHILVAATGGINHSNIVEYAKCGVNAIVTSSPYHAKPQDIKVTMKAL